jgi:hypothetical protein
VQYRPAHDHRLVARLEDGHRHQPYAVRFERHELVAVDAGRASATPSIIGTFGPYTSASINPTRAPSRARLTARLTATVDLPTPPLPELTATMFRTPSTISFSPKPRPFGTSASIVTLTEVDARKRRHDRARLLLQLLAHGARGRREHDAERDRAALNLQILYKAEAHDVLVQVWVFHLRQRAVNVCLGHLCHFCEW